MAIQTDTSPAVSATDTGGTTAVQSDIENALFGGPISQAAPELANLAASPDISDSSQLGGMDYSFYTNPGEQPLPTYGYTDLTRGDPTQDFYGQLPAVDLSQFDVSDSGAYVNPDGSVSMP